MSRWAHGAAPCSSSWPTGLSKRREDRRRHGILASAPGTGRMNLRSMWMRLPRRSDAPSRSYPPWARGSWAGWLALLLFVGRPAVAATLSAALERSVASVGEPVTLTLAFTGGEPAQPPEIPQVPQLQITYQGQSRQMIISNGRISSHVAYTYTVIGREPGEYIIPALQIPIGQQLLSTDPLVLRVVRQDPRTQLAFLRLVVPQRELFVGEAFLVEVHLCLRDRVENIANVQLSPLQVESCTQLKQVRLPHRTERNEYGQFTVIPMVYSLVAARPGTLTVGPIDCSFVAEIAPEGGRRDPFGGLGFGVFRFGETRPLSVSAEPQTLRVLPLPREGVPPEFNGAVGRFQLSFQAAPTNVAVGDPITVKVQLRGRGVLEALKLPEQSQWNAFKTYPPTENVETTDPHGLEGSKTFELVVVPQTQDVRELPPLRFAFFDPETRTYQRLASPAVPLWVRAGAPTPVPALASPRVPNTLPPSPTRDILGLKQQLGSIAANPSPWLSHPVFWVVNSLPVLAWVCTLIWRRRADVLAADPRRQRSREARRRIRFALQQLQNACTSGRPEAFYAALFRLLQEQIGERLDLPASAITEAVIEERLRPAGLPEEVCTNLHELFQLCNQARYAPGTLTADPQTVRTRAESVLRQLQAFQP